jgi:hypothetical protein
MTASNMLSATVHATNVFPQNVMFQKAVLYMDHLARWRPRTGSTIATHL